MSIPTKAEWVASVDGMFNDGVPWDTAELLSVAVEPLYARIAELEEEVDRAITWGSDL